MATTECSKALSSPPQEQTPLPRLLTSWKVWLLLLFVGLGIITVTFSIPLYRRHQALAYLDEHNGEVEFSADDEWLVEWFGEKATCLRNVQRIELYDELSDESLARISALDETEKLNFAGADLGPITPQAPGVSVRSLG